MMSAPEESVRFVCQSRKVDVRSRPRFEVNSEDRFARERVRGGIEDDWSSGGSAEGGDDIRRRIGRAQDQDALVARRRTVDLCEELVTTR